MVLNIYSIIKDHFRAVLSCFPLSCFPKLVRLLERQDCDKEGELESLKVESRKALP